MSAFEPQDPKRILLHGDELLLQEAESTSAMVEYEPAGQGVHVELLFAPVALEHVPLAQFVQAAEPFAEKVPAGQRLHDFGPTGVQLVLQVPVKPA